jgi:ribonucleoside-diphosphate reductase alpha chain
MLSISRSLCTEARRVLSNHSQQRFIHLLSSKARVEGRLRAQGILSQEQDLEIFLQRNKLCSSGESVAAVFERASAFLAEAGSQFYGPDKAREYKEKFMGFASRFEVIYGSPILTNAGRRTDRSVSACSIPNVRLSSLKKDEITKIVSSYHTRGMGTGFSLDDVDEPAQMVKFLNEIAIREVQEGLIERSVGNMGVLSINHPKILSFIHVRTENPEIKEWKFNLSVNLTNEFINAWLNKKPFQLMDGSLVDPEKLMHAIALSAHGTGDPGLIFMDQINKGNKLPHMGSYKTVVPCGEVSLYAGEVCQFAYLNLFHFVQSGEIDKERISEAVHSMVVMLDNAVEANIERMPLAESANMISSVRRIGIGVCGFAETLQALALPYDSPEGRRFAENLMSFINFESKKASIQLARERGPFSAFSHPETREELFLGPFMNRPTDFVTLEDWKKLAKEFERDKIRNMSTTILPPTGRSSLIGGVTSSIEPPFVLAPTLEVQEGIRRLSIESGYHGGLKSVFKELRESGSIQNTPLPEAVKKVFATALEISPLAHLKMTAAFQRHIDEGISKTVNMPNEASVQDVQDVYARAIKMGLKGVTIYRNGCRTFQPRVLSSSKGAKVTITDPLYSIVPVSAKIMTLVESPIVQRLKTIRQNGAHFLVDPKLTTTRLEHSLGVLSLAVLLGASEEEQIAALLHDVTHTALSHVGDIVFDRPDQDYHNVIAKRLLAKTSVRQFFEEQNIDVSALINNNFSIVSGKRGVNLDRIDYTLRDLWYAGKVCQPEYASILNNLVIEGESILCRDMDTANFLFQKSLQANCEIYFDPKAEVANHAIGLILRSLLKEGTLQEEDFEQSDAGLIKVIKESRFEEAFKRITPELEVIEVDLADADIVVTRKLRYLDPQIQGLQGTLTDHHEGAQKALAQYLETPTVVGYHCPALKGLL